MKNVGVSDERLGTVPEHRMTADGRTSLLASAVQETLDAFVAPRVRNALIADALKAGGMTCLPSAPAEVRYFVEGPLRDTTMRTLGTELAESIAAELDRLVKSALQVPTPAPLAPTRRPAALPFDGGPTISSPPPTRRTFSPPPGARRSFTPRSGTLGQSFIRRQDAGGGPAAPLVSPSEYFRHIGTGRATPRNVHAAPPESVETKILVATYDPSLVRALGEWPDERVSVEVVRSLFTLISYVEASAAAPLLIVLDMAFPSVRPESLAALADDLSDVRIALVRSSEGEEQRLMQISPAVGSWITFRESTTVEEIASSCAGLLP